MDQFECVRVEQNSDALRLGVSIPMGRRLFGGLRTALRASVSLVRDSDAA